jgi:hypothetical protein
MSAKISFRICDVRKNRGVSATQPNPIVVRIEVSAISAKIRAGVEGENLEVSELAAAQRRA